MVMCIGWAYGESWSHFGGSFWRDSFERVWMVTKGNGYVLAKKLLSVSLCMIAAGFPQVPSINAVPGSAAACDREGSDQHWRSAIAAARSILLVLAMTRPIG